MRMKRDYLLDTISPIVNGNDPDMEYCVLINEKPTIGDLLHNDKVTMTNILLICMPYENYINNKKMADKQGHILFEKNLRCSDVMPYKISKELNKKVTKIVNTTAYLFEGACKKMLSDINKDFYEKEKTVARIDKAKNPSNRVRRFSILERDGFKCRVCGRGIDEGVILEVDHRYPKCLGGDNNDDNLWTLCKDCNRGKHARVVPELIGEYESR